MEFLVTKKKKGKRLFVVVVVVVFKCYNSSTIFQLVRDFAAATTQNRGFDFNQFRITKYAARDWLSLYLVTLYWKFLVQNFKMCGADVLL